MRQRAGWIVVLVLACVVGVAAGGPGARFAEDPPSPVIYPEQRVPLRFSHAAHLGRGVACVDCHRAAPGSRSAVDNLLPGEAACRACHPIDRAEPERVVAGAPPARCDACHLGHVAGQPVPRVYLPPPNLKFDHAAHVARGMACTGCHGDLAAEGVGLATRAQLPRMRLCLECHDGKAAPDACATCHLTEVGVLRTRLPDGALQPSGAVWGDAHDLDFARDHGAAASRDRAYCGSCHRESDCVECHQGTVKPMAFHEGDYALIHAVDARRNQPDCSTCHRQQSFCVGCHERSGVTERARAGEGAAMIGRRFHPEDWEPRHGREARANLDACVSCHREDDCLQCHTAEIGAPRVSPHGPGWAGSGRCEALARKAGRMCLRCHVTAVPEC